MKPTQALILITALMLNLEHSFAKIACSKIVSQKQTSKDLQVIRFGYLPIDVDSRVFSQGYSFHEGPVWSISVLEKKSSGELSWFKSDFDLDTIRERIPFPSNTSLETGEYNKSTGPKIVLNHIYNIFSGELAKRDVFTPEFLESLKTEDNNRLQENFTMWASVDNQGRIVAGWGLYKHTEGKFADSYEIVRTATDKSKGSYSIARMLPFITEHLNSLGVDEGKIFVRSDAAGARLYQRHGAVEVGQYESGNKFILEMSIEEFIGKFTAPEIIGGGSPIRVRLFMGEPVAG